MDVYNPNPVIIAYSNMRTDIAKRVVHEHPGLTGPEIDDAVNIYINRLTNTELLQALADAASPMYMHAETTLQVR